ncbi:hypothetical protein F4806DRAFT_506382 [Annulohypoxylon nitens]|nr:hypothetical protein F4806DRAFT_506382 [Annulohypoxylon nitens]
MMYSPSPSSSSSDDLSEWDTPSPVPHTQLDSPSPSPSVGSSATVNSDSSSDSEARPHFNLANFSPDARYLLQLMNELNGGNTFNSGPLRPLVPLTPGDIELIRLVGPALFGNDYHNHDDLDDHVEDQQNHPIDSVEDEDHDIIDAEPVQAQEPAAANHNPGLQYHNEEAAGADPERLLTCNFPGCGKLFTMAEIVARHLRRHNIEAKNALQN